VTRRFEKPLFELGTLCLSILILDEPLFLSLLHIVEEGEITSKTVSFSGSE